MTRRTVCCVAAVVLWAGTAVAGGKIWKTYGSWHVVKETDPITDEVSWGTGTYAVGRSKSWLVFTCSDGEPTVGWETDEVYLGSPTPAKASIRFDKGPVLTEFWFMRSAGGSALLTLSRPDVARLADMARKGNRVVLRAEVSDETVTKIFPLDGFTKAISKVPCFND